MEGDLQPLVSGPGCVMPLLSTGWRIDFLTICFGFPFLVGHCGLKYSELFGIFLSLFAMIFSLFL